MEEELSRQQEQRVRRMLAEARHTDPIPSDVADRLDRAITGLAAEPDRAAPVVQMANRRRRVGRLILAAAAVVVVGVGIGQVVGKTGQHSSESSESGTADSALQAPDRDGSGPAEGETGVGSDPGSGPAVESQRSVSDLPPQPVREDRFVTDARAARASASSPDADGQAGGATQSPEEPGGRADTVPGCEPGIWGGGRYVPVSYGRTPGWLVLRPPLGGTQVADLFLCGENTAERSATLPYR